MPISPSDLKHPTNKLFSMLENEHPGYFDNVDISQICKLLDLVKNNQPGQPVKGSGGGPPNKGQNMPINMDSDSDSF